MLHAYRVRSQQRLVKCFGGCHPAGCLPRAFIEFGGDGVEVVLGEWGEVAAFGEVLAQQPVGVLIGTALPLAWVAEVDRDIGGDAEASVGCQLLCPGPR